MDVGSRSGAILLRCKRALNFRDGKFGEFFRNFGDQPVQNFFV